MDVSAILNNSNYIKQSNNSSIEANTQTNNIELSSIPKGSEEQNNKKYNSNKSNGDKDLNETIDTLNKFLANDKTHAEYSVYKDLGRTMIKIIDDESDKVLMEFPQEKILNVVTSMLENAGILDKKA